MRRFQIAAAEVDYKRWTQELDRALEIADVVAEPWAHRILTVERM